MKATDTQISHNPTSNAKLGNGIARLPEMLAAGLNVGLGHDAAECNNSRDMFQVMKFAAIIHRANRIDSSLQPTQEIIRMATRNGSEALRHDGGQIAVGKKADVIIIDTLTPMFTPLLPDDAAHVLSHLTYAANGSCVRTNIIDGRIVMEDRQLTFADEAQIVREANLAFLRVHARIS
jgi:5-methylthioadenosine/S-adenosylhomocysteine deaminase